MIRDILNLALKRVLAIEQKLFEFLYFSDAMTH